MAKDRDAEIIGRVLNAIDEDSRYHDEYCNRVNRWYRSYRGVMERRSAANDWTNKVTAKYAAQIIETMTASLMDPRPRWRLRASARFEAPPEIDRLRKGAKSLELLLYQQRKASGFLREQRTHRLQALVAGLTATKTQWAYQEVQRPRNVSVAVPVYDDYGDVIGHTVQVERVDGVEVAKDDPVVEVVDVRHLIWSMSATSPEKLRRVTHRLYYSFDELKRMERSEANPNGLYRNVDKLKESKGFAREHAEDDTALFRARPDRDDIEVLEHWYVDEQGQVRLAAVGNRKVLLRDQESPFWHGQFPFTFCSGMPYPFQIPGVSDVEMIEQLQEMMWTLQNQRLDNLQLVNNAIVLLREDLDDPDSFEFYPGARNMVADPAQVQMWTPDPQAATISLSAEAQIKADLQAISGGAPWLSGDNSAANSDTATEASILTNLAHRRVAAKKQFFLDADAEVGNQFIDLNDQFLTEKRYVELVGMDGMEGWELIDPDDFREYRFRIEIDSMDESLMRNERRAEAQAKLQVALSAVPVFAALSQVNPQMPALNPKAFMDDFLDAFDVGNKDRYYSAMPQPAAPQPGQPQQPGLPGEPGVSAPQAVDANSPSNAFSQSPVAALQRMGAMAGGPVNQ